MKNQINFLREEWSFKTKLIIYSTMKNHQIKLHKGNATLMPNKADDDYQFSKLQACKIKFQSQSNPKLTLSNR